VGRAGAAEGFPRSARIRKRADFLRVQQRGKKVSSGPLVGLVLPGTGPIARLGLTVSSKVGNAVVRARVKRQLREVFLLALPIHLYRWLVSPWLPRSCRFYPSCSAYALLALRTHGPFRGSWLALRRLSRCHPLNPGGVDLVPPAAGRT
jgi:putative membrane protein insertion efficiency factor